MHYTRKRESGGGGAHNQRDQQSLNLFLARARQKEGLNQGFLHREITKGLGRSRADRGLKFGECKGAAFAPSCNLNAFYEAFMTAMIAFA